MLRKKKATKRAKKTVKKKVTKKTTVKKTTNKLDLSYKFKAFSIIQLIAYAQEHDHEISMYVESSGKNKRKAEVQEEFMEWYGEREEDITLMETVGLSVKHLAFISEYLSNGYHRRKAYMKVYPGSNENSAHHGGTMLLQKPTVKREIVYRMKAQEITADAVMGELWDIAKNYRGEKTINAAVQALKTLAQAGGMLTDVVKHEFTVDNPAVFRRKTTDKERDDIIKGNRITE